jgi:hypothetical protein
MARMSREFNLVLLGAGLLTAGSFLVPDEDPAKHAEDETNQGGGGRSRYRAGHVFIITHYSRTSTRTSTSATTARGGFGRIGGAISGG